MAARFLIINYLSIKSCSLELRLKVQCIIPPSFNTNTFEIKVDHYQVNYKILPKTLTAMTGLLTNSSGHFSSQAVHNLIK